MNLINKKYAENLYKKNISEVYQSLQSCSSLSLVTVKYVW